VTYGTIHYFVSPRDMLYRLFKGAKTNESKSTSHGGSGHQSPFTPTQIAPSSLNRSASGKLIIHDRRQLMQQRYEEEAKAREKKARQQEEEAHAQSGGLEENENVHVRRALEEIQSRNAGQLSAPVSKEIVDGEESDAGKGGRSTSSSTCPPPPREDAAPRIRDRRASLCKTIEGRQRREELEKEQVEMVQRAEAYKRMVKEAIGELDRLRPLATDILNQFIEKVEEYDVLEQEKDEKASGTPESLEEAIESLSERGMGTTGRDDIESLSNGNGNSGGTPRDELEPFYEYPSGIPDFQGDEKKLTPVDPCAAARDSMGSIPQNTRGLYSSGKKQLSSKEIGALLSRCGTDPEAVRRLKRELEEAYRAEGEVEGEVEAERPIETFCLQALNDPATPVRKVSSCLSPKKSEVYEGDTSVLDECAFGLHNDPHSSSTDMGTKAYPLEDAEKASMNPMRCVRPLHAPTAPSLSEASTHSGGGSGHCASSSSSSYTGSSFIKNRVQALYGEKDTSSVASAGGGAMKKDTWQWSALPSIQGTVFDQLDRIPTHAIDIGAIQALFKKSVEEKTAQEVCSDRKVLLRIFKPSRVQQLRVALEQLKFGRCERKEGVIRLAKKLHTMALARDESIRPAPCQFLLSLVPLPEEVAMFNRYFQISDDDHGDTSVKGLERRMNPTSIEHDLCEEDTDKRDAQAPTEMPDLEAELRPLFLIPRLPHRLRAVFFIKSMDKFSNVEKALHALSWQATSVIQNRALQDLIRVALSLGNYVNFGTVEGPVSGFRLSSLLTARGVNLPSDEDSASTSLLHVLILHAAACRPDIPIDLAIRAWTTELHCLHLDVQLDFEELRSLVRSYEKEVVFLANERYGDNTDMYSEGAQTILDEIYREAAPLSAQLLDALAETEGQLENMCTFLGYTKGNDMELFRTLKDIRQTYVTAAEDLLTRSSQLATFSIGKNLEEK